MCNLYRMTKNADEVAHLFDAIAEITSNAGGEIYPGYPGMVLTASRQVETMTWGFPLVMKSKRTGEPLKPKPVNNARTDKLSGGFWKHAFVNRRCLIPVEAFAEAQGPKGAKTRTWLSLPDSDLFAVAGIWRPSEEWGDCYSMVMTECCQQTAEIHDRMPVILRQDAYATWLQGDPQDAFDLCKPYDGIMEIDRTDTPWAGGASQKSLL